VRGEPGEVLLVFMIDVLDEPGPDVKRNLGAMLTSVFVVKRSAFPFDCGSRETE
jgi:hypothetical protein